MNLYAPKYYTDFVCIADRCRHSCCIGWEIDVDSETHEKYRSLSGGYGEVIKNSIDSSDTPHFKLCEEDRCPHLNEKGLCRIILNLGEDHLCHICREHPRFYNQTLSGTEVGLGIACEEACRIILSSDSYGEMLCVGKSAQDVNSDELEIDSVAQRDIVYSTLGDRSISLEQRLSALCERYSIFLDILTDSEWRELLSSLEYLYPEDQELFSCFEAAATIPKGLENEFERLFAYFIYRHCSGAYDETDFVASLFFSLFCTRLVASIMQARGNNDLYLLEDVARKVSEELEYSEDNTEAIKTEYLFS